MRIILDIETDSIKNVRNIWCVVCMDVDTKELYTFKGHKEIRDNLPELISRCTTLVGHNLISYDLPWLRRILGIEIPSPVKVIDTLVLSRLHHFKMVGGHSLDAWGSRLGFSKGDFNDFSRYSSSMLAYCIRDVELTLKLFLFFEEKMLNKPHWESSIKLEHQIATICRDTHEAGFEFDIAEAVKLHAELKDKLDGMRIPLSEAFPSRAILVREITPKETKHGTLSQQDFRWKTDGDLTSFSKDAPFSLIKWVPFNPASTSQIVSRMNEAGWRPVEKTKGHIDALRRGNKEKIAKFKISGWKVSEKNLATLPLSAPESAHTLSDFLLTDSRRSTMEEWINAYYSNNESFGLDGRLRGTLNSIGTWTHRMSHVKPNLGNPPRITSPYGYRMRSLLCSKKGYNLVGCDASGIQLRVLAHYVNDPIFTHNIVSGDPHQANMDALGKHCKTRNVAKTFIYAWLLGAGLGKVAEILGCASKDAKQAIENFLNAYKGLGKLKGVTIPRDAIKGYFSGLDGRFIVCDSTHLMLSGYLQNGEAVIMKLATSLWMKDLDERGIAYQLVNFIHDEFVTEVESVYHNSVWLPTLVAERQKWAIEEAGRQLNLNVPLDAVYKIGKTWADVH